MSWMALHCNFLFFCWHGSMGFPTDTSVGFPVTHWKAIPDIIICSLVVKVKLNSKIWKNYPPDLMISVSFSSAEDASCNDVEILTIFISKCTVNPPFYCYVTPGVLDVSDNGNSILGIHLEYTCCCYVGQISEKLYGCQNQPLLKWHT